MSCILGLGDSVTLIHGDCAEHIERFDPDWTAVVTDPPYGMSYRSHHNSGRYGSGSDLVRKEGNFPAIIGDDRPFNPAPLLPFRWIVLWGAQIYAYRLPNCRQWLVWDKLAGKTPSNHSDCELAWTNQDGPARIFTHLWRGIMRAGEENVTHGPKLHAAQKPVALAQWTFGVMRIPAEATILDPYMGSGSFAIAAIRAGYKYVGIEIDADTFATAEARIRRELQQPQLGLYFTPPNMSL